MNENSGKEAFNQPPGCQGTETRGSIPPRSMCIGDGPIGHSEACRKERQQEIVNKGIDPYTGMRGYPQEHEKTIEAYPPGDF